MSFCFWFKVYNLKSSKILNFETNEKNGFKFTVQGKYNYDATIKCNVVKGKVNIQYNTI